MQGLLSRCCPFFLFLTGHARTPEKLSSQAFRNAASRVSVLYFLPLGIDLSSLRGWRDEERPGAGGVEVRVGEGLAA